MFVLINIWWEEIIRPVRLNFGHIILTLEIPVLITSVYIYANTNTDKQIVKQVNFCFFPYLLSGPG